MRERQPEFDRLGVRIYGVSFESRRRIDEYRAREEVPFTILRDPRRSGYAAFGFRRRSVLTIWSPRTLWYYARRLLRGRRPEWARSDPYQLGGDVIIAAGGSRGRVYRSAGPAGRPSVEAILTAIREMEGR